MTQWRQVCAFYFVYFGTLAVGRRNGGDRCLGFGVATFVSVQFPTRFHAAVFPSCSGPKRERRLRVAQWWFRRPTLSGKTRRRCSRDCRPRGDRRSCGTPTPRASLALVVVSRDQPEGFSRVGVAVHAVYTAFRAAWQSLPLST